MSDTFVRNTAKRKATDALTQPVQETDDKQGATDTEDHLAIWCRVLKDHGVLKHLTECINAHDILVYFHYMPRAWADKIKAVHTHQGQSSGVEELLEHLAKLADGDNDWPADLRKSLYESGHDLLVKLLDETYEEKRRGGDEAAGGDLGGSIRVEGPDENYNQDFAPAAQALLQYHELWIRTFTENKKQIRECIEPTAILPYMPYLPRDRIRAACDTRGTTRGADELIECMFGFTNKPWMKHFIEALRAPGINQNLIGDLLEIRFNALLEETKNDPNFKDLHAMYAKACDQLPEGEESEEFKLIYYGPRPRPKDCNTR